MTPSRDIADLLDLMARLRSDCPWDAKQTNQSLTPYAIEEAYELAEAIALGDMDDVKGELGDVLLQVVFHAHLYAEQDKFDFGDVIYTLMEKLIRRHPHVFDKENLKTDEDVKRRWDEIKAIENQGKPLRRVLDIKAGSSLMQAQAVQKAAVKVGFDWDDISGAVQKLHEEIGELTELICDTDGNYLDKKAIDKQKASDELGDCFLSLVNIARKLDIDSEMAALGAVMKFKRRFGFIEDELAKLGKRPEDSDLSEMDRLWDLAKTQGL
ncbi:nucleoside triphosphate pyrophosphohydrolase [Moraxella sp. FZLJ2107]|uniref:nucleoside triphosphate pyrophosphohydrolase n=1 Tax=unclassified Moraxella TaxID=2685852 RepID=UPI0020C8915E|nr:MULTISPECIES: nucleoside triphosphate pyrophosphohydrolase [unclassified Moraxella]UTO04312.1 nucleoside triphosphate pyrophosphohydrolase [Moraxella sp. FZLJ2107]UTO23145.1 nucleoside triphosphate pyrophosphohydrolase [Moraxella sp. FZLJ2109]